MIRQDLLATKYDKTRLTSDLLLSYHISRNK